MKALKSDLRGLVTGALWLTVHYRPLRHELSRKAGLSHIRPTLVRKWHRGARYFRAQAPDASPVFVKTDERNWPLETEARAWSRLQNAPLAKHHLAAIRHFEASPCYTFLVYDRVEAWPLSTTAPKIKFDQKAAVLAQFVEIADLLNTAEVIHRDITPGNLLIQQSGVGSPRVILIDFAYALMDRQATNDKKLRRLDLAHLCHGFKPSTFTWDDVFSLYAVATVLLSVAPGDPTLEELHRRIGRNQFSYPADIPAA